MAKPAIVRAATAHLDLVMIDSFRDVNGRMSRCLQTLVLAREKILARRRRIVAGRQGVGREIPHARGHVDALPLERRVARRVSAASPCATATLDVDLDIVDQDRAEARRPATSWWARW